jgi:diacylglycerol kinase (ATP)
VKSRLIVNPVAGRDAGGDAVQVLNSRLREAVGEMDIVLTVAAGDAAHAAAEAASAGCERIFVAGGDGTLNEALNGVASVPGGLEAVTFGVIPMGTGNDFATALGIPAELEAAIAVLVSATAVPVDVGVLGEHRFVNVSGGGFIAEVSDAVNPGLKTIAGKLAYLIGGAQVLLDYLPVHAVITLETGTGPLEREMDLQMFAVGNSRMIGGGGLIAPEAWIDDGFLDVCLVEAIPTAEFVRLLSTVPRGGHLEDPRVSYFRATSAQLKFQRPVKVNTDGEVLETAHCDYRVLPGAARFLVGENPIVVKSMAGAAAS